MLPLLLAMAGGGLVVHHVHKKHQASQAHPLAPLLPHPSLTPARPPAGIVRPPAGAPVPKGVVTPARAAIHGELMQNCIDPNKLVKAAHLFGAEGLPFHAEALANKAQVLHQMIHAAQDIVQRCNAGDQHAMALAKGIGEQARAGNKRAQVSAWLITQYQKANPAQPKAAA